MYPKSMLKKIVALLIVLVLLSCQAQDARVQEKAPKKPPKKAPKAAKMPKEQNSVTEHSVTIAGKEIEYTATAGMLHLKNDAGKATAGVFYIAYMKKGVEDLSKRPLTFSFNGGPGSSSVWLHLGTLGPAPRADEGRR